MSLDRRDRSTMTTWSPGAGLSPGAMTRVRPSRAGGQAHTLLTPRCNITGVDLLGHVHADGPRDAPVREGVVLGSQLFPRDRDVTMTMPLMTDWVTEGR